MGEVIAVSTVWQNGKTQVPHEVRRFLDLADNDRIVYFQDYDGRVYIEKGAKLRAKKGKYR